MSQPQEARDEAAEQAVLGCMLLSPRAVGEVMEEVCEDDFASPRHGFIFARIVQMYLKGDVADAVTLSSSLMASGDLVRVGGAPYLHLLMGTPATAAQASAYAQQVAAVAKLRRFQTATRRIHQMGEVTVLDDLGEILDKARDELEGVPGLRRARGVSVADAFKTVMEETANPVQPVRMRSGLHDLDEFYRGVGPGELNIVGARPAQGKSLLGLGFIRENTVKRTGPRIPTVLFTMEMGASEVTRRLISACSNIELNRLTDPVHYPLTDRDLWAISQVQQDIEEAPLTIVPEQVSLADVVTCSRDLFRGGDGFVVLDFLQLMSWPGWARREEEAVGYNAYGLAQFAQSQNLRVLSLAQLNRNPTQRAGGVPLMADIGGSGKVEQAAHAVILIDRPDTRDENEQPGEANLYVPKQRDGRTGVATVAFRGHRAQFSNMARDVE